MIVIFDYHIFVKRRIVKKLVIIMVCFLSCFDLPGQEHELKIFTSVYYNQVDEFKNDSFDRVQVFGGSIDLVHSLKEPALKFIGSHLSVSYDGHDRLFMLFGIDIRFTIFKDLIGFDLHLPQLYFSSSHQKFIRPVGVGITFGRGNLKLNVREMVFGNQLRSFISIRYQIFKI